MPFLIPTYGYGMRGKLVLSLGMKAFELIGVGQNRQVRDPEKIIPPHRVLSRSEVLDLEPEIETAGLTGGVRYDECHMYSSERTTLALVLAAVEAGAVVANYTEVVAFLREGEGRAPSRVAGVWARDALAGDDGEFEIRARLVANMTGPWAPSLLERLENRSGRQRFALSKGCHIVTRPLTRSGALALATSHKGEGIVSRGGRHFFIIPWRGRSLIGTTNVPYTGDPAEVGVTERDIADFIGEINGAHPAAALTREDVQFFFSGLYPLVDKEVKAEVYQGANQYEIRDHRKDGVDGLITVIGAKYTTARNLARQAIDLAFRKLGKAPPRARTATTPVPGGRIERFDEFHAEAMRKEGKRLGEEVVRELVLCYGSDYPAVLQYVEKDPEAGRPVAGDRPTIRAMIQHAVLHEMALRLADVIFRRTGLGTIGDPGEDCLRTCASIMGEELGWSVTRVEEELEVARTPFRTRSESPA
jgi:glycerol-3-phosphate dehydrogenase